MGFQYYFVGFGLSLAVTSGTISVVSRLRGAGEHERASLALKQSLWLALLISVPLTVLAWVYAEPYIRLLTDDATAYAWQTLRIALAIQVAVAAVLVVFARPIVAVFGTDYPTLAVDFVRVFALVVAGFSVSRTMRGALRGAGDTTFPLYGTILGAYVARLPIAFLALPTTTAVGLPILGTVTPGLGLGLLAIYLALVADFYVKAAVNTVRFRSGRWRAIARAARVGARGD